GLFNSRLWGIEDWDLWVRLAELFPVAAVDAPVGVYRVPGPASGQASSAIGPQLLVAARYQERLLRLPRPSAATERRRREARSAIRRRVADTLSWHAATRLPEGEYRFAVTNFLIALWLSPLWAMRPGHLRQFWKSFMARRRRGNAASSSVGASY
ncbi:MAG: hypothetical protein ACRD68_03155, partial [Pyrinomonadaceae bacterium]